MGRKTARTKKKDDLFFMYLACTGSVTKACEESGYSIPRVYEYRISDIAFYERWVMAMDSCAGLVEGSLVDVLVNGDSDYKVLNFTDTEGKKHSVVKRIKKRYPAAMLSYLRVRDSKRFSQKGVKDLLDEDICDMTEEQLDEYDRMLDEQLERLRALD